MPEQEADSVKVVLFFDANMPQLDDESRRYPSGLWVTSKPIILPRANRKPVIFNRAKDIEIAEWCLSSIREQWVDKRYVLMTHDHDFITDAQRDDERRREDRRRRNESTVFPFDPLEFRAREHLICSGPESNPIVLEVFIVKEHMDRWRDVAAALAYAKSLCA